MHSRLRIKGIATSCFGNGHAQVDIQSDPRDLDAGVVLVARGEKGAIMVMMVAMTV